MKKLLVIVFLVIGLAGCKSNPTSLNILAPQGSPSLSLMSYINDYKEDEDYHEPTIVAGPELLASNLMSHDSEFDAIIAPVNLGATLIASGKTDYKLLGIVSWGNLYVVENPAVEEEGIVLFGEGSVPDVVFKDVLSDRYQETRYVNSAAEAQVSLLSDKTRYALLPEPVVSAVMSKNSDLKVGEDIQDLWQFKHGNTYPQAGLFVKASVLEEKSESVEALVTSLEKTSTVINEGSIEDLVGDNIEFYGFNNKDLIINNASKLNINYQDLEASEDAVRAFLNIFGIDSENLFSEVAQ